LVREEQLRFLNVSAREWDISGLFRLKVQDRSLVKRIFDGMNYVPQCDGPTIADVD